MLNKSQVNLNKGNKKKKTSAFYLHDYKVNCIKKLCPYNLAHYESFEKKNYLSLEKAFPPGVDDEVCKVLPPD